MRQEERAAADLVARLSRTIDEVLAPLLPAGVPCALVDFPNYPNVGDSAIWLAELEWLRRGRHPIVYACDLWTYSPARLAACLGDGVILLSGGGNLGDFWVEHQRLREQVVQDFPGHKIIQLPQTIYFLDEENVEKARRIFGAHKDLVLVCRDRRSLEFAQSHLAAPSLLCPDMAFALDKLLPVGPPRCKVFGLMRTDMESSGARLPLKAGVERADWLEEEATPAREHDAVLSRRLKRPPADWRGLQRALADNYTDLARERLLRGCHLLSRGRVVVTDRLHGHILCLLLGIRHVIVDNNYGKVLAFYDTWTNGCPLVRSAATPAEALALAEEWHSSE
jgi:pyruvyl transferase EpsO